MSRRFWFGEPWASPSLSLDVARGHTGAELRFGGERSVVGLFLGLYFVSIWLSFEEGEFGEWRRRAFARATRRAAELTASTGREHYAHELDWQDSGRDIGFRIHDGSVWWSVWRGMDDDHQREQWPWDGRGWLFVWPVSEWLFGRETYEPGPVEVEELLDVVMPEGRYPATVRLRRVTRSNWFRLTNKWRAEIDVPGGIPVPGKGENSWDCDDDAVHGSSGPEADEAPTTREVAVDLAMSCLQKRARYAALDWAPRDGWPPHRRAA